MGSILSFSLYKKSTTFTDHELYQMIQNGSEKAFEHLYKTCLPQVEKVLLSPGNDPELLKDMFQDAIIALWQNIKSGKYQVRENAKMSTYLIRMVQYRLYEKVKSGKVKYEVPLTKDIDAPWDSNPEEQSNQLERIEKLQSVFNQLGDKCKNLLGAFYFEKKSMADIAAMTGLQPASVKNEKYRCMEKLKSLSTQIKIDSL
ncbi:MAG: sigma-70 family RNA polymerase sigma factor [Saprospiraceae bacterium]|jgi:RNA polymerase sigma factor (sigma-70 family)|nr:sigma-70 family RNA polymerase sigma factor [Saprospiraceae bacterium]